MNKKSNHRPKRVGDQIKRKLAQLLQFNTQDPRFSGVTVIDVEMSPDLSHAKIFFSILREDKLNDAMEAFKKASGFFRKKIADNMDLRIAPQLVFIYDESILRAEKLSTLINQVS